MKLNFSNFIFAVALRPNAGHGLLILEVSRSHTTRHSRQDSSGQVISSSQRPLPDNTQHSQQTNIHAPGWIRTHNLSRRAATDLRRRPRGHWDRHWWTSDFSNGPLWGRVFPFYFHLISALWQDQASKCRVRRMLWVVLKSDNGQSPTGVPQ